MEFLMGPRRTRDENDRELGFSEQDEAYFCRPGEGYTAAEVASMFRGARQDLEELLRKVLASKARVANNF